MVFLLNDENLLVAICYFYYPNYYTFFKRQIIWRPVGQSPCPTACYGSGSVLELRPRDPRAKPTDHKILRLTLPLCINKFHNLILLYNLVLIFLNLVVNLDQAHFVLLCHITDYKLWNFLNTVFAILFFVCLKLKLRKIFLKLV